MQQAVTVNHRASTESTKGLNIIKAKTEFLKKALVFIFFTVWFIFFFSFLAKEFMSKLGQVVNLCCTNRKYSLYIIKKKGLCLSLNSLVGFHLWVKTSAVLLIGITNVSVIPLHLESSLPFSTLPNYSSGMKLGLFALQSICILPSSDHWKEFLLWACIMEASNQSSSQQVLWKDVSLILFELFRIILNANNNNLKWIPAFRDLGHVVEREWKHL